MIGNSRLRGLAGLLVMSMYWLLGPVIAGAAEHYVCQSATGDASGSDWTNAYPELPPELIRGDTYLVAAGQYPAYKFDDPEDGARFVTIRKATEAFHGTDIGWDNAYGEGVAVWGPITVSNSYFIFDGVTGADKAGHGFEIYATTTDDDLFGLEWGASHVRLSHANLHFSNSELAGWSDAIFGNTPAACITIDHCYIHDIPRCPLLMRNWNGLLFEHNWVARNRYTGEAHSEGVSNNGGGNYIFRYNVWEDIEGTAVIVNLADPSRNWEIYGNLFFQTDSPTSDGVGHGLVSDNMNNDSGINGVRFYNNTAVNIHGGMAGVQFFSPGSVDTVACNNIWYQCDNISNGGLEHDYNYYSDSTFAYTYWEQPGLHDVVTTGSPFVDPAGLNFHLAATVGRGCTLPALYASDGDGLVRGADGTWDLGAWEYVAGNTANRPPAVSAISIDTLDADSARPGLQMVTSQTLVLAGTASDPDLDPLSWSWSYRVDDGSEVPCLSGIGLVQPVSYTSGADLANHRMTWILKASDGKTTSAAELDFEVVPGLQPRVDFANLLPPADIPQGVLVPFNATVLTNDRIDTITLWGDWSGIWRQEQTLAVDHPSTESIFANGELETFNGGVATGWTLQSDGLADYGAASDAGHNGLSQRIDIATEGPWGINWYQELVFVANQSYQLSGWYKTSGANSLKIEMFNYPTLDILADQRLAGTNGQWRPLTMDFDSSNTEGAVQFRFKAPGSVWLDELRLNRVTRQVLPRFTERLAPGTYHWALQAGTRFGTFQSSTTLLTVLSRIMVDPNAPGPEHDGMSWGTAYKTLQPALDDAYASGIKQVWVADGTLTGSVALRRGVAVYGGFAGYADVDESRLEQRDWRRHLSLLDGQGDVRSVVIMDGLTSATLDGFSITGGNGGGGLDCRRLDGSNTIAHCTITGNTSDEVGGGLLCSTSTLTLSDCIIAGNVSNQAGGGVACVASSPAIVNCTVADNQATSAGGGLFLREGSRPVVTNCLFHGNSKWGIDEGDADSDVAAINCLFDIHPEGDLHDEGATSLRGAAAINAVEGNTGNVDGNPRFLTDASGSWTAAPSFDAISTQTTLTDTSATFVPGALVGRLICPNANQTRLALIVDNTATTLTVKGNFGDSAHSDDRYLLIDYRPGYGSPAIDSGSSLGHALSDMAGDLRPVDIAGVGRDGSDAFDIGAYEVQDGQPEIAVMVPTRPIDFGSREIGSGPTATQTVTITNEGFGPLNFIGSGVRLVGTGAADFMIVDKPVSDPLVPGATRTVLLAFAPMNVGARTAQLRIATDDADESVIRISLTGAGLGDPPAITVQPVPQTVNPDATVSFSVGATGSPLLGYQWKKDGVELVGATSSTLTIASARQTDEGNYSCLVTNAAGGAESSGAVLVVNDPPTIVTQPIAKTINSGAMTSFGVDATSLYPMNYQWRKDGVNLSDGGAFSGAESSVLMIQPATSLDAGMYDCLVSDAMGGVLSEAARLTVNPWLDVASDHGEPTPAIGRFYYTPGMSVTVAMASPPFSLGPDARLACTGWLGGGSIAATGTTTSTTFVIDQDTTITWQWKTQYRLGALAEPAMGGMVVLADGANSAMGWHEAEKVLTLRAQAMPGYRFALWSGDLGGQGNPTNLPMDRPKTIMAHFEEAASGVNGWALYE